MNRRMIMFILGRVLLAEAIMILPSMAVGLIYREKEVLSFLPSLVILLALGLPFGLKSPDNTVIFARDGFFAVASSWVLISLFGALPFYFSGGFETIWDCIFEIVSGFTTTGASVLAAPEELAHCILFWRSFSHWVGGMGVLVFILAIVPLSDNRSLHLMRAEVPGPVVGKLLPRMKDTAKILYIVYSVMTVVLIIMLLAGGMPMFDSVCIAFGAAGTGGFTLSAEGIASYNSAYIEIVLGVFMLLFGVNFNLFFLILTRRAREAFKNEELRWYGIIVAFATVTIAVSIYSIYQSVPTSLRHAFFQVSSILTTTGYATADFAGAWPQYAQHMLVLLMIVGACAGSTGGGLKVSRCILLVRSTVQEVKKLLHPRSVTVVRMDGHVIDMGTIGNVRVYFVVYMMIVCISVLLLSLNGFDFTTNLTAELACFNNIGPGIGMVGPMSNYGAYSPGAKLLLSLNMLLGRLEIFPMLVLFTPNVWRRNI